MSEETSRRITYSPVEERHIDFLLEEEFATNADFFDFFLAEASKGNYKQAILPARHSSWRCEAVRSVTTSAGETDLLVRYDSDTPTAKVVAILIEDKIRAGFQDNQPGRYRQRGDAGLGTEWDRYWTCLVSPAKYISTEGDFDARVSLEALRDYFAVQSGARAKFRVDVLTRALEKSDLVGVQKEDLTITEFRTRYEALAKAHLQGEGWTWDRPRTGWRGDTWFTFRRVEWPRALKITHKAEMGVVHLSVPDTSASRLEELLQQYRMQDQYTALQTSKSASFQVKVPAITDFGSDMPLATVTALYEGIQSLSECYLLLKDPVLGLLDAAQSKR